jgi:hypothetical protein
VPIVDKPTRYRDLLRMVSQYGIYEDVQRAKGSERLWIRELPDGSKRSIPVTCHGEGYVIGGGLIKAIRRRLRLTPQDDVSDEAFYTRRRYTTYPRILPPTPG